MKRFFKPIEKEGSAKKPSLCSSEENGPSDQIEENGENNKEKEPLKFVTWNANSLLLRVKNDWPDFSKFVSTLDPDVIALQEVRMPAAGSKSAPKNPRELKEDTSSSREEKQVAELLPANSLDIASSFWRESFKVCGFDVLISHNSPLVQQITALIYENLLILMRALSSPPFRSYRIWWSLADSKYAGTALLVKKCFQPIKVSFSLDRTASKHEQDGRVIFSEFENFYLLNTYAPNNGWKDEENSFQRRRKWDKRMLEFVMQQSDKPLIWCGDLNCSHEEIDVSHPDIFSAAKLNGYIPPNKEDCGQPGFTLSERRRFGAILKEGKLIDAYRYLHQDQDMERGFSWSGNPIGKYRGKRMRIDYFIVSEKLKDRIVSCEMHGQGIELQGFYGSDHCPVSLELSPSSPDAKEN